MKQTRSRHGETPHAHSLLLTLDEVLLLNQASAPLEQLISSKPTSFPNLRLAQEALTQAQAKVASMIKHHVWGSTVAFDANEVILLHTAVRVFLVNVQWQLDLPQTAEAVKHGLLLQSKLDVIIARTRSKRSTPG